MGEKINSYRIVVGKFERKKDTTWKTEEQLGE
jgi:hypothetical protein